MEIELTIENFDEIVLSSDKPVLVDFWATWCGPCRMIGPNLAELAERMDGSLIVGKINVDEQPDLAMKYGVAVIPTLMLFKNGQIAKKTAGYMDLQELEKFVSKE